jgi:hypothetical protein
VAASALLLFAAGCARVYVPPRTDLGPHQNIGIIKFKPSIVSPGLAELTTQKFIQAVTEDQPGIRVVELGDETSVLAAVSQTVLGFDAWKAIGEKYGVRTVFAGDLNISNIQPKISIGPGLNFASFEAEVDATLFCRLVETGTGATIWSGSASEERTVGGISKWGNSYGFNAEDPNATYGDFARSLTRKATRDFRETWHYRCCGSRQR